MEPPPTQEEIEQAVKYYRAVKASKKKCWANKHPNPNPRGRPRKSKEGAAEARAVQV